MLYRGRLGRLVGRCARGANSGAACLACMACLACREDVNGEPIPFSTDDEILDFLRTARVVSETPIGVGINESIIPARFRSRASFSTIGSRGSIDVFGTRSFR